MIIQLSRFLREFQKSVFGLRFRLGFSNEGGDTFSIVFFFSKSGPTRMLQASNYDSAEEVLPFPEATTDFVCGTYKKLGIMYLFEKYVILEHFVQSYSTAPEWAGEYLKKLQEKVSELGSADKKLLEQYGASNMTTQNRHLLVDSAAHKSGIEGMQLLRAVIWEISYKSFMTKFGKTSRQIRSAMHEIIQQVTFSLLMTVQKEFCTIEKNQPKLPSCLQQLHVLPFSFIFK